MMADFFLHVVGQYAAMSSQDSTLSKMRIHVSSIAVSYNYS